MKSIKRITVTVAIMLAVAFGGMTVTPKPAEATGIPVVDVSSIAATVAQTLQVIYTLQQLKQTYESWKSVLEFREPFKDFMKLLHKFMPVTTPAARSQPKHDAVDIFGDRHPNARTVYQNEKDRLEEEIAEVEEMYANFTARDDLLNRFRETAANAEEPGAQMTVQSEMMAEMIHMLNDIGKVLVYQTGQSLQAQSIEFNNHAIMRQTKGDITDVK